MGERALDFRSAFYAVAPLHSESRAPGVIAQDRDGLSLASVMARRGQLAALAGCIRERYGVELPRGNVRVAAPPVSFVGVGPESWLACEEGGGSAFAGSLTGALAPFASVADQSDGYAILRVWGPNVRDALAKLAPIDLHPRAFEPGRAACSVASHIGVTLWRLDDDSDGYSVFEIALFRSFANSFWHALAQSAAEYGIRGPV
jgi:methylglutamate dehydrogenase subunit D